MSATAAERRLASSIAAHTSWANTTDRTARTAAARRALEEKFLAEADGDPQRAESLRKAYFQRLALRSSQARRRTKAAAVRAQADAELDAIVTAGGDAA